MTVATGNRLLPVLASAVVLMLAFVAVKSCTGEPGDRAALDAVPRAPAPDADTPADTIKTLTANVAAMTAEVEALRGDNAKLRDENRALVESRARMEDDVATRVTRDLLARRNETEARNRLDAGTLSSLTARVDALADSLSQARPSTGAGDIPVGLGLEGVGGAIADTQAIVWVPPLDAPVEDATPPGGGLLRTGTSTGSPSWSTHSAAIVGPSDVPTPDDHDTPVYTVPRNATLIGSTAMTALVGRVPVQGQVRDPMPFKVITGADNLAANGLTVPGVRGMVWSGTAVGDWSLSCVTGRLDAVTFVFDDGTIRTLAGDDRRGDRGTGSEKERTLGWISDDQGIPCVTGERKTNAPAFLTQRIGVMAIQAAADAAAAAETTSVVSDAGAVTGAVTGDTASFVLGKTVAGGSDEIARWLMERQSQSFDAVFVPAGRRVAIHVDRELAIDFAPQGRKLSHAHPTDPSHRARLD